MNRLAADLDEVAAHPGPLQGDGGLIDPEALGDAVEVQTQAARLEQVLSKRNFYEVLLISGGGNLDGFANRACERLVVGDRVVGGKRANDYVALAVFQNRRGERDCSRRVSG